VNRLPKELVDKTIELTKTLNEAYDTLMDISTQLNNYCDNNNFTEDDVNEEDIRIIELLEDTVWKFNF
jgi:hypothetical protein